MFPFILLFAVLKSSSISERFLSLSTLEMLLLIRTRKLYPPFGPPALENEPTAFGLHSRAKAEFSIPLHLTWLVGAFHTHVLLRDWYQ